MKISSPHSPPRNRRLMRQGLCLTGAGLFGGLATAAILTNGWSLPAAAIAALICAAAGLVVIGFAVMVVAADPFAD
jgi:hypothetical protein